MYILFIRTWYPELQERLSVLSFNFLARKAREEGLKMGFKSASPLLIPQISLQSWYFILKWVNYMELAGKESWMWHDSVAWKRRQTQFYINEREQEDHTSKLQAVQTHPLQLVLENVLNLYLHKKNLTCSDWFRRFTFYKTFLIKKRTTSNKNGLQIATLWESIKF